MFTPTLQSHEHALFLLRVRQCPVCKVWMLAVPKAERCFSEWRGLDIDAQLARAGWQRQSATYDDTHDAYICAACAASDTRTFVCVLCGQQRPPSESQESFGMPAEHLCKACYTTAPANVWIEKTEALHDAHRWDFE